MGALSVGEKYVPLFLDRGRPGLWVAFWLFLAFLLLLPTIKAPDHQAGFMEGLGVVFTIAFWTFVSRAVNGHRRVTRLARTGDTLHVDLRSFFPGFPRGFTCPVRDALAWEHRGRGLLRTWLVFNYQGKPYYASIAGNTFLDTYALVDTYPQLARVFGIRPARPAPTPQP